MSLINKLNLLKYKDVLTIDDRGRTPHIRIKLATGSGDTVAIAGYGLPATYEAPDFTPETARNADPKAREFVERHPAALHAARSLADIVMLHTASLAIGTDSSLSDSGRSQKLKAAVADTIGKLGSRLAAIDPLDAALRTAETKLLAVPEADSTATIVDSEVRNWLRSLSIDERRAQLIQLGQDPARDRMLLAVRRSPVPLGPGAPDADILDAAWRAMAARTQPKAWQTFSDERETTDWAQGLVRELASLALNPRSSQGGERLDRLTLYKSLKPAGGTALRFGRFQEQEIGQLEHQLAAAAA